MFLPFDSSVKVTKFALLQMKYFLFAGENATGTDDKKCAKQFKLKSKKAGRGKKTGFDAQSPGKGGPVTGSKNSIMVKEFFVRPTHPPSGSKNVIFCFLANMRYIRDGICTGHIRRRVYFSVPAG